MKFLRENRNKPPSQVAQDLLAHEERPTEGDWHIAPGFGSRFGGVDIVPEHIASLLVSLPGKGDTLQWANDFVAQLRPQSLGWLYTGLAAAGFVDLGFHPRTGAGLFQVASAPGLLAHGLEFANKPRTAYPFPDDDHYIYEGEE
jgi:citrate synthase